MRVANAAVIIVVVAELSKRFPRYGALLLASHREHLGICDELVSVP